MTVGTFTFYNGGKSEVVDLAFASADYYTVLCTGTYTPSVAHTTYANLTNQVTGYTRQDITVSRTGTGATQNIKATESNFGTSTTITAKYCVLVHGTNPTTPATTDELIGYLDLKTEGGSVSSSASNFKVSWGTGVSPQTFSTIS